MLSLLLPFKYIIGVCCLALSILIFWSLLLTALDRVIFLAKNNFFIKIL